MKVLDRLTPILLVLPLEMTEMLVLDVSVHVLAVLPVRDMTLVMLEVYVVVADHGYVLRRIC
jgi:hypothetical protein